MRSLNTDTETKENRQFVDKTGSTERAEFNVKALVWYYGEVLCDCRKELGIIEKELAEHICRERSYISRMEKG